MRVRSCGLIRKEIGKYRVISIDRIKDEAKDGSLISGLLVYSTTSKVTEGRDRTPA
jgi:hypothetical protein